VYLPVHTIVPFNFFGDPMALRDTHLFYCFGRLKPGVSVSEAETDLKRIHAKNPKPRATLEWATRCVLLCRRAGKRIPTLLPCLSRI
ncbi:MAG: hypothetical protein WB696_07140, partial [Chthoniobacterales bacterium]